MLWDRPCDTMGLASCPAMWRRLRLGKGRTMNHNEALERDAAEPTAGVEELELEWWEPLGYKRDVELED